MTDKEKTKDNEVSQEAPATKEQDGARTVEAPGKIPADAVCEKEQRKAEITIESLQAEMAAEKDRVLRLSAEFDNYKKRTAREMDDFRKFANESLFKQILTVVDNLERAIATGGDSEVEGGILEGVKLTHREMMKFFNMFNITPVKAEGKPFDPAYHQAVTQQETDEHPANTVIMELQKGYLLHERLLRPSMVVVSKALEKKEKSKKV
ncbi:MAG: nucleotide exchange factor GrpE [Pseudomonadota bacterium]